MKEFTQKSLDDLVSLSRAEFLKNLEVTMSDELLEYHEVMDEQAKIDIVEEDNSMQYAYNEELPYIF